MRALIHFHAAAGYQPQPPLSPLYASFSLFHLPSASFRAPFRSTSLFPSSPRLTAPESVYNGKVHWIEGVDRRWSIADGAGVPIDPPVPLSTRVLRILSAFHARHTGARGKWLVSIYRESSAELFSRCGGAGTEREREREKVGLVIQRVER